MSAALIFFVKSILVRFGEGSSVGVDAAGVREVTDGVRGVTVSKVGRVVSSVVTVRFLTHEEV